MVYAKKRYLSKKGIDRNMKKIIKKVAGFVLLGSIFSMIFSGCGQQSNTNGETSTVLEVDEEDKKEEAKSNTRKVIDHTGKEVEIPSEINRIVISSILPLPSVYCLFEGSVEKLVGMHPSSMAAAENSMLPKIVPDIVNVNTDFLQGDELNIEELLNLEPDVVFYSADNTGDYEKLTTAGIPCIGFSTSNWDYDCVETFENWVILLGEVLQQQDKAEGIAQYGHEVYEEIQTVMEQSENIEKPRALILFNYGGGVIRTSGSKFFGQYWLDATGAVNMAEDLVGSQEINMEQIYEWNPDIIYITNFSSYQPEDLYENAIEGDDWSSVKAVENKKVYKFPLGMYRWFPPASDTPLVLKWLAKKNQPELFEHIHMEEEVSNYYERFYGITLTDEEIEQIFNPAREAAGGK